jgi:hypothetical protein
MRVSLYQLPTWHVLCTMHTEAAYFWSLAPSAQAQGPFCGVIRRRKVPLGSASVMLSVAAASRLAWLRQLHHEGWIKVGEQPATASREVVR